jgi:hypothetical protein
MAPRFRTKCFVDGCGFEPVAHGYCRGHYKQLYRHGRITGLLRPRSGKAVAEDRSAAQYPPPPDVPEEVDGVLEEPGLTRWPDGDTAYQTPPKLFTPSPFTSPRAESETNV